MISFQYADIIIRGIGHTHGLFDPNWLTTSQSCHLLHVRKIEFFELWLIFWCEHVLFPWRPKQTLHDDLVLRQSVGSVCLSFQIFGYPTSVHKYGRAYSIPLKRCYYQVTVVPSMNPWPNQHFLIVPEAACSVNPSVIEVFNYQRIDSWWQW